MRPCFSRPSTILAVDHEPPPQSEIVYHSVPLLPMTASKVTGQKRKRANSIDVEDGEVKLELRASTSRPGPAIGA